MLNGAKSTGKSCGKNLNGNVGRRFKRPKKHARSGGKLSPQRDSLSRTWIFGSIALFVGEEGGGRCRSEEKSKGRTFPPRLEIPQEQRDSHFSHRHCREEQHFDFPV